MASVLTGTLITSGKRNVNVTSGSENSTEEIVVTTSEKSHDNL